MDAALRSLRGVDEAVLVDYDDPEEVGAWAVKLRDPCVCVVRVQGCEWFHMDHARNLGGRASAGEVLIFSDIDFQVSPALIEEASCLVPKTFLVQVDELHSFGFVVVHRADFFEVQGFEEALTAYGHDDFQFRNSLMYLGRTCQRMRARLEPIRAGEQVRVHQERRMAITAACNARIMRALRMLHPFRNNVSRNWGWGGVVLQKSRLGESVIYDVKDPARVVVQIV
jgi:hypothetical protein